MRPSAQVHPVPAADGAQTAAAAPTIGVPKATDLAAAAAIPAVAAAVAASAVHAAGRRAAVLLRQAEGAAEL